MFSSLQKPQESVNAEDLEILQNEIEQRLAENVIQKWELQRELNESGEGLNCTSPDSNNHTVHPADGAPRVPSTHPTAENTSDGFKGEFFASNISKHRSKIVPSKFRHSCEESPRPSKDQVIKNEAPDKLWPFVEQFCATPTEEQIKELQEMIDEMDSKDSREYYKLPNVVTTKDAAVKDSTTKNDTAGGKSHRDSKNKNSEEGSWGALTLRLVSSFFDDSDDINADLTKSPSCPSSPPRKKKKTKNNKSEEVNEAKNLEKKIRQQLEEYSILSHQDNIPYTSEDDEDLRLLVGYQNELRAIREQNKYLMEKLLTRAKKHFELDKERQKLRDANADVIAAYHRLIQAKQRKRNPTKKEKDAAWKALKVYEPLFKNCDDLYMNSLEYSGL